MPIRNKPGFVTEIGRGNYRLQNKFFELWLANEIGIIDRKFDGAKELFAKEREAMRKLPRMAKLSL